MRRISYFQFLIPKQQGAARPTSARAGFTLIEIVIAMGITMMVGVLFVRLSRDVTDTTLRFSRTLITQQAIETTLQVIIPEIRSIAQSNDGSFPISVAATSTFEFYSDIDRDGLFDRVRYFLDGATLTKGVIKPTGSPLAYVTSTETLQSLVDNIIVGSQIFTYYDRNATTTNSVPLQQPVSPLDVKTIRVSLVANQGTSSTPSLVGVDTEATIRNLRYK